MVSLPRRNGSESDSIHSPFGWESMLSMGESAA